MDIIGPYMLSAIFEALQLGYLDEPSCIRLIILILKGDKTILGNLRHITWLGTTYKIFAKASTFAPESIATGHHLNHLDRFCQILVHLG